MKTIHFRNPRKLHFSVLNFCELPVFIFILSVIIFWSLVSMDNYEELKTKYNQLTECVNQTQQSEEKQVKSRKEK